MGVDSTGDETVRSAASGRSTHIVLKLSKLCNLRCGYCYEFDHLADPTRMPLEGIRRLLAGLVDHASRQSPCARLKFVLHGGEPLILPLEYLDAVCLAIGEACGTRNLEYQLSVQTNLTHINTEILAFLQSHRIGIGVSFDVIGQRRLDRLGRDSQDRVVANVQTLIDRGVRFGGIAVLHRHNIEAARHIYSFYEQLGTTVRLLPVFARNVTESSSPDRDLLLPAESVVAALCDLADHILPRPGRIRVSPLDDYTEIAVRDLTGGRAIPYDPMNTIEWAMIVDVNGDVYCHGDAYTPEGLFGNAFSEDWVELMEGPRRAAANRRREGRRRACDDCAFRGACSGLPAVEAYQSYQVLRNGTPRCSIARPVVKHIRQMLESDYDLLSKYSRSSEVIYDERTEPWLDGGEDGAT